MMFSGKMSSRARVLWLLVFGLSPLACVLGVALTLKYDPNATIKINLDRNAAITRAREYAAGLGIETEGWVAGHRFEAKNERYFYYRLHQDEKISALRQLAPVIKSDVAFVSRDGTEKMYVGLSTDGALINYSRTLSEKNVPQDQGAQPARALADATIARLREATSLTIVGEPEIDEDKKSDAIERTFSYRLNTDDLPGLNASYRVTVVGAEVTGQETEFEIDEKYAADNLLNSSTAIKVLTAIYIILLTLLFIYGLYRYFRLTQQKEVPHSRTILICVVSGVTLILFGYQIDFYLYDDFPTSPALLFWGILAVSALGYLMMGLIFGIAYSSSESDVRATYPDRLVSLDALLAGRIFSRNVARSVLVGAALGGWALLAERLFLLPFAMRADGGQGLSENTWTIFGGSLISLVALLTPPFSGVTVTVLGLLLPLAFLHHRRIRSQKIFLLSLALLCVVANLQTSLDRPVVLSAGFLIAATLAGVLLIAFFFFDVLTAIVAIGALSLVSWLTYLTSQPAGSLRQAGIITLLAALLILLVETYFLFRGRLYSEADVRPLYARFLAERVQMQAEESAAREAQVRLMPQQLPTTAGLELAAVCHPAHTVGGDFYDLFPLADDRLGLFVAEGGGGGLGSALTIAFAKGFLMPRVASGAAPGDIICSLQTQLAPMLQSNEELTIAFAIIDPHRKTISYARTGEYPLVHVERADDSNGASTFALTESVREWTGEHASERETDDGCTIREASLQLSVGDAILFFTDGIGKTLKVEHASPNKLMRDMTKHLTRKAGHTLQDALGKTVAKQARQARRINMDDDLTAVVIRFTQTAY